MKNVKDGKATEENGAILRNINHQWFNRQSKERQAERLKKYQEEYDSLPEDHYKKKQLAGKIYILNKKVHPTVVWDSSKGVYRKGTEISKVEVIEKEGTVEE